MGHLATIYGEEFKVAPEPSDYWGWVNNGNYDHEWRVYQQWLRPAEIFVDLGAWVGAHSLYASTIARAVIAVEPDPVAFAILNENLPEHITKINKAVAPGGSIVLGSGCLGASTTRVNLSAGGGIGAAIETFEVACISLRKLLEEVPDPLFIKMDIEGGEEQLIGDLAFFEEHKPKLLLELHPWWWADRNQVDRDLAKLQAIYREVHDVANNTLVMLP